MIHDRYVRLALAGILITIIVTMMLVAISQPVR